MKSQVVITGDTEISIPISASDLASVVRSIADHESNAHLFQFLARHEASEVRESIARNDHLNEETVVLLVQDQEINVLRELIGSAAARRILTTEVLIGLLTKDVDLAESIASQVERYENANVVELARALANHADPKVRAALASNCDVPKKILKALELDSDLLVRNNARQALS